MPSNQVKLYAESSAQREEIKRLAALYGIDLGKDNDRLPPFRLLKTADHLELQQNAKGSPGPIYVDFIAGKTAHRLKYGGGKGQPLARAIGLKSGRTPRVIDATAGLGRDAFVLASLGCRVEMIERSAVVAALLADGLQRARQESEIKPIIDRLTLVYAEAVKYLASLSTTERPDVIYLDPMYPHTKKTAQVKKEMYTLQKLLASNTNEAELLAVACAVARKRVVVKRPSKAEFIDGQTPSAEIQSPNTRYDLYFS